MTQPTPADPDPLSSMTLILQDTGDPMYRSHGIRRSASYRAKIMFKRILRDCGFRNEGCRHVRPDDVATPIDLTGVSGADMANTFCVWRRTAGSWELMFRVGSQGGAELVVSMAVETAPRAEHRNRANWMVLPSGSEPAPGEQVAARANR